MKFLTDTRCFSRGLQKKINKSNPEPLDTSTVQSSLELALSKLSPSGVVNVAISSRTDKGVHALHSAVHVDLERQNGEIYDVKYLTALINRNLHNEGLPIRVLRADIVPDTFHCRYNAKSRTYLYRLAIAKDYYLEEGYRGRANYINYVPIEEANRCWFLATPDIDIERVKRASQLFVGRHDYRTFMNAKRRNDKTDHPMYTIRKIDEISISPGRPLTTSLSKKEDLYNYWDVKLSGRSFLYKQVRRIIGTLVCHGQGKISEKDLYEMLTIPSKYNWIPKIPVAPPYGLYLAKVDYDFSQIIIKEQSKEGVLEEAENESLGRSAGEEECAEAHRHEGAAH